MRALIARLIKNEKVVADPLERTMSRTTSRAGSIATGAGYSNRVSFLKNMSNKVGLGGKKINMAPNELARVQSVQAHQAGRQLSRGQ
jgi:H+-transporting ATPase